MMRSVHVALLVLGLVPVYGTAVAQWGIGAEIGVARFAGSSRDTSGTVVGPYRPTTFELRVDRGLGPTRVAIAVEYAKTGIAGEQESLAAVQYDAASFWEIAPQVSWRLARFGAGVEVRIEAGPAFTFWDLNGEKRNRVGGRAAAAFEWPLTEVIAGSLRVCGTLSESIFDQAEVPAGVERRATRRLGGAVGLRYRL
ncbi:MAG TPA: hypothetical protein VM716_12925 [Gemmatimonadales bacterium]|nr:hypothetical protein [Gemmatimonadales bacterium]